MALTRKPGRYIIVSFFTSPIGSLQRAALAVCSIAALALIGPGAANAQETDLAAFELRAAEQFQAGRYADALAVSEQWAQAAEKAESAKGKPGFLTASALGNVAWNALFAKQPERALAAADRAILLSPGTLWMETNRAHALLFLGRTEEAIAACIEHKGETISNQGKWEEVILKDFAEFQSRGLDHPKFQAVAQALAVAPQSPGVQIETLSAAGKFAEALPLAERYAEAMKARYGESHLKYAVAIDALAGLYMSQGRYSDAGPLFSRALQVREQTLGSEHPDTIANAVSLAANYEDQGRYGEAEPLFKRALASYERLLGNEHRNTLASVSNLASLYRVQGRYAEAEPLYRRALQGEERVLGPEHPDTLVDVSNLGALYYEQGRYGDAEPLLKRALAARERLLGRDHPKTLKSVHFLALVYKDQGRYSEAEALYRRVIEGRERVLGREHPDTVLGVSSLASVYEAQGRYGEAEPLFKRVFEINERTLGKEHPNTLSSINNLAELYRAQGRFAQAEPLYLRSLDAYVRVLGKEHPYTLAAVGNLAQLYEAQGRYGEAEPLFKRAIEARERVLGKEHPDTLKSVGNLAGLYEAQGLYTRAEPLFKRALETSERVLGRDHPDTIASVGELASFYRVEGRYDEAEQLFLRETEANLRVLGKEHPNTLSSVNNLAVLYRAQGRYAQAEQLCRRALAGFEHVLGADHPNTLTVVDNLAGVYGDQGRYGEAELLHRRSLEGRERVLGKEHPDTIVSLNNLALLYRSQGRYAQAEALLKRTLEADERVLGKEHPQTQSAVNNLAALYEDQNRYSEAEPLYKRALEANERALGRDHPNTLDTLNNLALLYWRQGRFSEAEPLLKRAIEARGRVLGQDHPDTLESVNNLALVYQSSGRYQQAEPLFKRALEGFERAFGPEHPLTLTSVNNLAALHFGLRDWPAAAQFWRRSTAAIARRTLLGAQDTGQALAGKTKGEAELLSFQFFGLVKAVNRLPPNALASREMFETAQWALSSEAAKSLAQMAARGAKGDPALAALARERQDLLGEWQKRDGLRNAALGQPPAKRDAQAEAENSSRLAAIDTQIAEIDKQLAVRFPDYAALASPAPLSAAEVQAQLNPDEALVFFLNTEEWKPAPEETFIWVVTKTDMRWVRSELGTPGLTREVRTLRCGLDASPWEPSRGLAREQNPRPLPASSRQPTCRELLGQGVSNESLLPFDLSRANALYKALFGQVEDLIQGKQLLIVPSGPLTQLPFQVLVTDKPDAAIPQDVAAYAKAKWLGQRQPITVLPSVSSLKALRRHAGKSTAPAPYLGFGNPLLTGPGGNDKSAWAVKSCQAPSSGARILVAHARGLARPFSELYKPSGAADVEVLRRQPPLPDTADELCAVARLTGAGPESVYLGANATEARVAALSAQGALAKARVVHFATHGLVAGETQDIARAGKAEPALLLTPPQTASEADDGLLTASEVAALKLDADWVLLSACNTAAGGANGAEALSGLARAFFYAGARALLVSHWYVDSAATVELVTGAFGAMRDHPEIGRAEAMRRAMTALIAQGGRSAHPSVWAPFAVVGEGGR